MLKSLISRGDQVAIVDGILQIQPASGKPVPDDWYSDNKQRLITEIAKAAGVTAYSYARYTTGYYGAHKSSGVTLHFVNTSTGESPCAIFNVGLKRVQASKCGKYKKGDPLKKSVFAPPANGGFCQFWERSNLPKPRYQSEYNRKMGQLKSRVFTMTVSSDNRVDNKTLTALSVPHDVIVKALGFDQIMRGRDGGDAGQVRGRRGAGVGGSYTAKPDAVCLTDESDCVSELLRKKDIRKEGIKEVLTASIEPYGTVIDPLNTPIIDQSFRDVPVHLQTNNEWLAEYDTGEKTKIGRDDERWDQCI